MPRGVRGTGPITREHRMVEWGLDPRTIFPKCDLCGLLHAKGDETQAAVIPYGRWAVHDSCRTQPEHLLLASLQLPPLNYGAFEGPPWKRVVEMRVKMRVQESDDPEVLYG